MLHPGVMKLDLQIGASLISASHVECQTTRCGVRATRSHTAHHLQTHESFHCDQQEGIHKYVNRTHPTPLRSVHAHTRAYTVRWADHHTAPRKTVNRRKHRGRVVTSLPWCTQPRCHRTSPRAHKTLCWEWPHIGCQIRLNTQYALAASSQNWYTDGQNLKRIIWAGSVLLSFNEIKTLQSLSKPIN